MKTDIIKLPTGEEVTVRYKQVKNITLRVKADGSIHLSVPSYLKRKDAQDFLDKKINWIKSKRHYFNQKEKHRIPRYFLSGESIPFQGKEYILDVKEDKREFIIREEGKVILHTPFPNDTDKKMGLIDSWYKQELLNLISSLMPIYERKVTRKASQIRIRKMKTRWGSCNVRTGSITFNLELAKMPMECVEYVILHELLHLVIPNHSKIFWSYVEQYMSDYKERKKMLNSLKRFE